MSVILPAQAPSFRRKARYQAGLERALHWAFEVPQWCDAHMKKAIPSTAI